MTFLRLDDHVDDTPRPFSTLAGVHPRMIGTLLQGEPPDVVSAVIAEYAIGEAAAILAVLPVDVVAAALVLLAGPPDPGLDLGAIEARLVARFVVGRVASRGEWRGARRVEDQLECESGARRARLTSLMKSHDPHLLHALRDPATRLAELVRGSDRQDLAQVVREVRLDRFAQYLATEDEATQGIWMACVSKRVAETLREELELLGEVDPVTAGLARVAIWQVAEELIRKGWIDIPKVPDLTEPGTQPTMAEPI